MWLLLELDNQVWLSLILYNVIMHKYDKIILTKIRIVILNPHTCLISSHDQELQPWNIYGGSSQ